MRDAQVIMWKRASSHAYGNGLETGIPSMEPAKRVIRSLHKKGFANEAKALETVLVGCYRPDEREGTIGRCIRCVKIVRLGRLHEFYECSDNDKIEDPTFVKACKRIKGIPKNFVEYLCFWLRGLLPRAIAARFRGTRDS